MTTRVKDAGFIQLHFEKLLLGAGLLILLVAVVLFVIGNPFKVEISGRAYPNPQAAVDELKRNDDMLEIGLANSNPIELPDPPQFDAEITAMNEKGIGASTSLAKFAEAGLTDLDIKPIQVMPSRYTTVLPPTPTNIISVLGTDNLDIELNKEPEAFFKLWGSERTDFSMFIASGEFEIWEWANRLRNAEADQDGIKIPVGIWSQRFGIAGVALLREQWDPESELWVDRKIVEPMPDQVRLLPSDEAPSEPILAVQTLTAYRAAQVKIAQPELPWVESPGTGFTQIVPPGETLIGEGEDGFNAFGIKAELGPNEQRIKDLEEKIQQLEERRALRDERREKKRQPDRPDRPDRPDLPRPDSGSSNNVKEDQIQKSIDRYRLQIERLQPKAEEERRERERLDAEREEREARKREREALLGRDNPGGVTFPGEGDFAEFQGVKLQQGAKVRVYAADPTMRPGTKYRYKLLVATINPLYAVHRLAPDQLSANKAKASLWPSDEEIDAMQWIEAETEPRMRFFFVSGTESSGKVEVFSRIKGVMQKHRFDVSAGDMVGGVVDGVDLSTGLILVDIESRRSLVAGTNSNKMIFIDKDGNLIERLSSIDSNSDVLDELDKEVKDGTEWKLRPDENDLDDGPGRFDGPGIPSF